MSKLKTFLIGCFVAAGLFAIHAESDFLVPYTIQKDVILMASGAPGAVFMTAASTCPRGSLAMQGGTANRTSNAALFQAIGTVYGTGDGSTTFGLPNAGGVFIRGAGSQTVAGVSFSGSQGTAQADQLQGSWTHLNDPGHAHQVGVSDTGGNNFDTGVSGIPTSNNSTKPFDGGSPATSLNGTNISPDGQITDGSHGTPRVGSETRPANIVLLYCIKT